MRKTHTSSSSDTQRAILPIILIVAASFLLADCSPIHQQTIAESPDLSDIVEQLPTNAATIEQMTVIVLDAFPTQVNVIAQVKLPNNCKQIDEITEEKNDNLFKLTISTIDMVEPVCREFFKLVEQIIPLNVSELKAGIYTVKVNGLTDTFELLTDNIIAHR